MAASQDSRNPKILRLGELVLRDKERPQPGAGRLDLLLQDPESLRRYEVEIQLGKRDESNIIRTIEYWDIERRRYPQYDHCAVIVFASAVNVDERKRVILRLGALAYCFSFSGLYRTIEEAFSSGDKIA